METDRNKGGRPAIPEADRRKQWDIRLTAAEVQRITAAARRTRLAPRVAARQVLLDWAEGVLAAADPGVR